MIESEQKGGRENIDKKKVQTLSRSKNSDKVSNLVVTVRGSENIQERKKIGEKRVAKKKAQKLKREKFFFLLLQSGFLTSWLDPKNSVGKAHKDIQFWEGARATTDTNKRRSNE